jgi:deoxyribodipyrimidine photo-lyase
MPTHAAALAAAAAVDPARYAHTRNHLDGAVSGLSPWLTHGLVTLTEVADAVSARHPLTRADKFSFELGWRAYFRHVWQHRGDGIFVSLHAGPLPEHAYAGELPADVREARTGVPVVDQAVRMLYASGHLHNHARMWLASYVVHLRRVHWRAGADWLAGHLLDGDLASNHLSWQWVAGTGSLKPYLFDAANVSRYAPPAWHSPGTVLDAPYEVLGEIARGLRAPVAAGRGADGMPEPALRGPRPSSTDLAAEAAELAGAAVWIVHPWALRAPPPAPSGQPWRVIGLVPAEHRLPWSERRWRFVAEAASALGVRMLCLDSAGRHALLASAASVHTWAEPHADAAWPANTHRHETPALFPPVERLCGSFSQWWARAGRSG